MATKRKTTKAHFELFKKECVKWQDFFGLKDWKLYFDHSDIGDLCGQVNYNIVDGVATISLSTRWHDFGMCDDDSVRLTAFHEICELLLARLEQMAGQRYNLDELDAREESHRIIRRLENVVFK